MRYVFSISKQMAIFEALILIGLSDFLLSVAGGGRVIRTLQNLCRPKSTNVPGNSCALLESLKESYSCAVHFYPRYIDCLPRSITLFLMARRRGVPVRFKISVRKYPFASHAWVDFDGPILSDELTLIHSLAVVLTIPKC